MKDEIPGAFPANGFKLNVAVRYDTLFAQNFPNSTVYK